MSDLVPVQASKPTMLCVCSKASDTLLDALLVHFEATVVHDARIAARKASLGSYDVYLAYDPRSAKAALHLWEALRTFDHNTPIVIVCGDAIPGDVAARMRVEYDRAVTYPCSASELLAHVQSVLAMAEGRSLQARAEEERAIAADLTNRLSELEVRVNLSRQSLARAQEHVMRAYALRAFAQSGGTRASFDRYWPETFEEILRASYSRDAVQPQRN